MVYFTFNSYSNFFIIIFMEVEKDFLKLELFIIIILQFRSFGLSKRSLSRGTSESSSTKFSIDFNYNH